MKNNKTKRTLIYALLTIMLAMIVLAPAGNILADKFSDKNFLDRQNGQEFYSLPKNSVDVLIGGNSQVLAGYCAPEIYNQSGYTTFALGTCSQPIYATYYWLKEALKYQTPKVYLLEVSGLFGKTGDSFYIKAFAEMKIGFNKFEAVKNITDGVFTDEFAAYFSDLYRYNSRWNDLHKPDYAFIKGTEKKSYLGFASPEKTYSLSENIKKESYPVKLSSTAEAFTQEENEIYARKIVELCKENNIEVAFFKTVKESWTDEMYTATKNLADELGILYFDMNREDIIEELDIDYQNDFFDPDHFNYKGASKTAYRYVEFLNDNFSLTDHRNDEIGVFYNETYNKYKNYIESIEK